MNKDTNKFNSLDVLTLGKDKLNFQNIIKSDLKDFGEVHKLPLSYKILLENLLRNLDEESVTSKDIENLINLQVGYEIQFKPSRVLMQDYTGVPAVADLAAMRDYLKDKKDDPSKINPLVPVSLVIDHSLIVDDFANQNSMKKNVEIEFLKNKERYQLLKWAQSSFKNFKVFPPGSGICHQINIEFLANLVSKNQNNLFFDTVVGTDSHTTMVNSLSVLGWGVGGIEAESVMLGQSISMLLPEVLGVKLNGTLREGITATDLVLTITEKLRKYGVVGKFVEFFGSGLYSLSLAERATISNMAPEYGATCGLFPVDNETINYLKLTGRDQRTIDLVEKYHKIQKTWNSGLHEDLNFSDILEIDLNKIKSSLAGPKRPQDRIDLENIKSTFIKNLDSEIINKKELTKPKSLENGSVCIAAITSCTNTSNPSVLIGAGLLAKKAIDLGVKIPPWVKTSFAPGSKVVEEYLKNANLLSALNKLGFNIVGFGCTTCIGNSGPLNTRIEKEIIDRELNVCSVISGNRNFEGRVHPLIKSNFLTSPLLVLAFAISGTVLIDIYNEPISTVKNKKLFLRDIWPSNKEINDLMNQSVDRDIYKSKYSNIYEGDKNWQEIETVNSETFDWSISSTYIKRPPFLENNISSNTFILNARPLLILGDSVTTDHISPAGVIKEASSTGNYLLKRQVGKENFNSFGARRGNHEVMVRGTFANVRIRNSMVSKEGGYTVHYPSNKVGEIYDVAMMYKKDSVPLIVIAGKEYGTGSSRDWAAKGTKLLGVKVVIAESFERIHRSNLVGMGILPLEMEGIKLNELNLTGKELFDIGDLNRFRLKPKIKSKVDIKYENNKKFSLKVKSRIDTVNEIKYFNNDGILPYVLNKLS